MTNVELAFRIKSAVGLSDSSFKFDEIVRTIFSRKDAKNAKKKTFNINNLTLRPLRLCVRF